MKRNAAILRKINKHKDRCNLSRARKYINNKRQATWGWQDKLSVPRTKTTFRERRIHGCGYLKWSGRHWAKLANAHYKRFNATMNNPAKAICHVFGGYCSEAIRVSSCESGLSIRAQNGQYLGLFQMGSYARSKYGHGNTALIQVVAAYRYFVDSGRDWSPWSCKP